MLLAELLIHGTSGCHPLGKGLLSKVSTALCLAVAVTIGAAATTASICRRASALQNERRIIVAQLINRCDGILVDPNLGMRGRGWVGMASIRGRLRVSWGIQA